MVYDHTKHYGWAVFSFLRRLVCPIPAVEASELCRRGDEAGTAASYIEHCSLPQTTRVTCLKPTHLLQTCWRSDSPHEIWRTLQMHLPCFNLRVPQMMRGLDGGERQEAFQKDTSVLPAMDSNSFLTSWCRMELRTTAMQKIDSSRANRLERTVEGDSTISGCTTGIAQLLHVK